MAQQVKKCVSTELIDGNGNFNTDGMKKFEKDVKLPEQGRSYGVVAIMGPQNSGKSTLLNHLFGTNFKELDGQSQRCQTTKGVCLAQTPLREICPLVLDTEGSDGAQKKDDTFERQIALFVIAVSEIVMINMWYHDVGRKNAAGCPLLTVVFEVMLRIFTPRKVHLIFVLRDTGKTSLEIIKTQLINQLEEIWNEILKPPAQTNTALRDRFEIEVVALSSYEYRKEQFDKEVATLRERVVCTLASSELTTNRTDASAFTLNAKMIWDQIKENRDLDLPSQKLMVAEIRCNNIFQEKYQNFLDDSSWIEVKSNVHSGAVVQGFGTTVSRLINTCLSEYDKETQYFDEGVKAAKRKLLNEEMLQVVEQTYRSLLQYTRVAAMDNFRKAITDGLHKKSNKMNCLEEIAQYQTDYLLRQTHDKFEEAAIEQANWNHATTEHERLWREMCAYVDHIRKIIEKSENEELMEAEIRCNKIFQEKYQNFLSDLSWIKVKSNVDSGAVVQGFGTTVSRLINTCLSEYDKETQYFDEFVTAAKRKLLNEQMLQVIEPTYRSLLECIKVAAIKDFRNAITDGLRKKSKKKKRLEEIAQYQINHILNQTHDLFEDAAIKQASWNHAATEHEKLGDDMRDYVDKIHQIIEKNGDGAFITALKIGATITTTVVSIGSAALALI